MVSHEFAYLDHDKNLLPIGLRESFLNTLQYFISGEVNWSFNACYLQDQSRESYAWIYKCHGMFITQFLAPSEDSLGQDVASQVGYAM